MAGGKKLYIGEGDPVGKRLDGHAREKAFWNKAVFFTAEGGRLNKAHVQHLESRLYALVKEIGLADLEKGNQPSPPALSEEEYAWQFDDDQQEEAEAEIQEDAKSTIVINTGKRANIYSSLPRGMSFHFFSTTETNASLELVDNGVLVKVGSEAVLEQKQHFEIHGASYAAKRRELIESGILQIQGNNYIFTQDQFFSSASAAASVIAGQNHNADHWVTKDGVNLGDLLRAARAKSSGVPLQS